jgi:excisionase family DNA binding protein
MNQNTFVEHQGDSTGLQEEYPLTAREAAKYLGVSPQSVYLWVERKQIPHLRRSGSKHPLSENGSRNIPRFFQTGDGECLDRENMMVLCIEERRRRSGGFAIATEAERDAGNPHSRKTGRKLNGC